MSEHIYKRIKQRLAKLDLNETEASRMAGLSEANIRNMRRAIETGKDFGVAVRTLVKLAPVLKTTPVWLMEGWGPEDEESIDVDVFKALANSSEQQKRSIVDLLSSVQDRTPE